MQWTRETDREKLGRLHKWHNWFAWYPVRLHSCREHNVIDTTNIIWLEVVKRRFHNGDKLHMSDEDAVVFQLNVESIRAQIREEFCDGRSKTIRNLQP